MSGRPTRAGYRWLLLVLLVSLATLRWFDTHPIELSVDEPRGAGKSILRLGDSPVALLLNPGPRGSSTFDAAAWPYAWWNALEQEFGPVDIVDLREPPPALPAWRGAVLSGALSPEWERALQAWVSEGGRLLVDGCDPKDPWRKHPVEEQLGWEDLLPPPAAAFLAEIAPADPALLRGPLGSGQVTRLATCGGRLLQGMQQGRPRTGFAVVEHAGNPDVVTPVDLAVLPADLSEIPVADLLERRLLHTAFGDGPLLGFWHVPDGKPGAYLPSHDEESYGDRTLFQAEHENELGVSSSFFIIPGEMTAEALASLCDDGFDVSLHWDRGYPEVQKERLGLGRFRPFWREVSLEAQKQALSSRLPEGCELWGNRNHALLWDGDYSDVLERLTSAGFHYDSSYGPDGDRYGYVFGSALPFRPLDGNGLPLAILEIPFHFQDDERFTTELMTRLLKENANGYHGHLGLLAHPTTMGWRPSVDRFDGWLESYRLAAELDLWVGSHADLARFWERRSSGRIVALDGAATHQVVIPGSDTWIWVRPRGVSVFVDGTLRSPDRNVNTRGAPGADLYRLEAGTHHIEMR